MVKSEITDRFGPRKSVTIWDNEHLEMEARFAVTMIEKWGLVAAEPDGEDSQGRHKLRLSTPEELVDRAFEVARLFMSRARQRELIHTSLDLPPSEDIPGELG